MSRATVVDERYRLQPADLHGGPQRAVIRHVSFQGLERLTPVLHFDGPLTKHLALNSDQCRELIRILHSSLCNDWIGQSIELRPGRATERPVIQIAPPTTPPVVREQVARWRFERPPAWSSLWALLLLGLALYVLFLLERSERFIRLVLDWLGG